MGYTVNDSAGCVIKECDEIVVVDGPCRIQTIAYVNEVQPGGFCCNDLIRISNNKYEGHQNNFEWSAWVDPKHVRVLKQPMTTRTKPPTDNKLIDPFYAECRLCGYLWTALCEEGIGFNVNRLECPECHHQAGEPQDIDLGGWQ